MKVKNKMNINDLYFGVVLTQMSYSPEAERNALKTYNLFDFSRVKWSVARYVTMSDEEKKALSNPLAFCFGDVRSRTEFEFIVCPWPYTDKDTIEKVGTKVDTFKMYVEPNAELLMDLVSGVSISSARKYLTEMRKLYRR